MASAAQPLPHIPTLVPATQPHIPYIVPAAPPLSQEHQKNHTPIILMAYVVMFSFFIAMAIQFWRNRLRSRASSSRPEVEVEERVLSPRDARAGAWFSCMHILLSFYLTSFMSALPGVALLSNRFTDKFLPGYTASAAAQVSPNPFCDFDDRRILMLLIIYELAVIVGLLLYAKLSQLLTLGQMVIITPLTLLVGVILCFAANSLVMLTIGRFFMGLTPGVIPQINNRLIKEFAPQRARAKLEWCNRLFNLGSIAAYAIAYQCSSQGLSWRLPFDFLIFPLLCFLMLCVSIFIYDIQNRNPVTFGQLRRARPVLARRVKYQILTSVLGLDVLLQYIPVYFTFLGNLKGEGDYVASLSVNLAALLSILIASGFKLERFGGLVVFFVVSMVLISVSILHVMLDRLSTPLSLPQHPTIMIVATSIYCACVSLTKLDMEMFRSGDDVEPAISILNRVLESVFNIIILLAFSFLGCMLQEHILGGFLGIIVCIFYLILDDL